MSGPAGCSSPSPPRPARSWARRHWPALPVVITSGYLTDNLRSDARSAGVRQLLQKEYTLEQLGPLLQQVLADAGRSHPGG